MRARWPMVVSITLSAACGGNGSPGTASANGDAGASDAGTGGDGGISALALTSTASSASPGDAPITLTAMLGDLPATASWSLTPPDLGSLSATSGTSVQYTPPTRVPSAATVTISATAGPGLTATTTVTLAPLSQAYLDPAAGLDTNVGTQAKPLKTIKAALALAQAGAPKTLTLLAGTYDEASGETWGYALPPDVTVQANSAGVLLSTVTARPAAFSFAANGALSFITMQGFGTAVTGSQGSLQLDGVTFTSNQTDVSLGGQAAAQLKNCNSTDAGTSLQAQGIAQFSVEGGSIAGARTSIELLESASAAVTGTSISEGIMDTGGAAFLSLENATVRNVASYNIYVRDTSTRLSIKGGQFSGATGNASVVLSYGDVTIDGASFSSNAGNAISQSGGTLIMTGASVSGSGSYGIVLGKGAQAKIRNTSVRGNANGLYLTDSASGIDLGTAADPGGNTVTDNRNYSSSFGANLIGAWTGTVQAVGNTWNANLEGADAAGHYASQLVACPGAYPTLVLYNSYCSTGGSIQY